VEEGERVDVVILGLLRSDLELDRSRTCWKGAGRQGSTSRR
jgi:hypothetical protein